MENIVLKCNHLSSPLLPSPPLPSPPLPSPPLPSPPLPSPLPSPPLPDNSNVALSVALIDNATSNEPTPIYSNDNPYHSLGNITFIPYPNTTFNTTSSTTFYYYYDFGDGHSLNLSTTENVTHNYTEEGAITYTVNVVAMRDKLLAYHAVYNESIILIGKWKDFVRTGYDG